MRKNSPLRVDIKPLILPTNMPSEPDFEFHPTNDHPRESSSSDGEDILVNIQTPNENEFQAVEQPRPFERMESFQREKQISVDPVSLRGSPVRQASFTLVTKAGTGGGTPPARLTLLSASVSSSASSSPRSCPSPLPKKIWKGPNENPTHQSPSTGEAKLTRQGSSMRRSKSMGEGRTSAPTDDFDLILENATTTNRPYNQQDNQHEDVRDDGFKCGKLCIFLPRGRGKPVRANSSNSISSLPNHKTGQQAISRSVSLERFDCGSFASTNEREPTNLFFDLPLELIRCSVSDMQSPVRAAFVFDKDGAVEKEPKGVLKKSGSTQSRKSKSQESTRHVRFSTSSPTSYPSSPKCITPRLMKARADFNAFLEAQIS